VAALGLSVGMLVLPGCRQDSAAYCDVLRTQVDLRNFDPSDTERFDQLMKELAAATRAAPEEVKDDWMTVTEVAEVTQNAMVDPANADRGKLDAAGEKIDSAIQAITIDAKARCNLTVS